MSFTKGKRKIGKIGKIRKILIFLLPLCLILQFLSCKEESDFISLREIGKEVQKYGCDESDYLPLLLGVSGEDLHSHWGKPDGEIDGFLAEYWYIGYKRHIVIIYDTNFKVGNISIEENSEL